MLVKEIQKIAKKRGMATIPRTKTDLIRAIQRDEGYSDCYATHYSGACGQEGCLWRSDCEIEDRTH